VALIAVGYKGFCLLVYNDIQPTESQPTFSRSLLPPSSESKCKPSRKPESYLLHAGFLLGSLFNPEDGGNMFL
jgi:hypothetical protein